MMSKGKEAIVHIFPQPFFHQEALIIGNKEGLVKLKKAIEQALETGKGDCVLMPVDKENYACGVILNNEPVEAPFWETMKAPYAELLDVSEKFGPDIYLEYPLSNSMDIPKVQKQIAKDEKFTKEMIWKIRKQMEKSEQEKN